MFDQANNTDRANFAQAAVAAFAAQTGLQSETAGESDAMTSMLCALMHHAQRSGLDFAKLLGGATAAFWTELEDEGGEIPTWSTGEADFQEEVERRAKNLMELNLASCDTKDREGTKFTVIGSDLHSREIKCYHVRAHDEFGAFASAAAAHCLLEMVVALPGWLMEDVLTFPGESIVDGETVLDQPEVFGEPFYDVAVSDVEAVLVADAELVTDWKGLDASALAGQLLPQMDRARVNFAAMAVDPLPIGPLDGSDEIRAILREMGVLKFADPVQLAG